MTMKLIEQKTEWSEEDEKMFDVVRELAWKGYKDNDDNNLPTFGTIVDWIKSLKDRCLPQQQDWSEEDKRILGYAIKAVHNMYVGKHHSCITDIYVKTANWLKLLKDRV